MSKAQWIEQNLKGDEQYAGIILGKDGSPDHHLILLPGETESVTWAKAKEWAAGAAGELPTRREQSLLFANLKDQFQPGWYWSSAQRAARSAQHAAYSDYAWSQYFYYGFQNYLTKSAKLRARAVRRLIIQ